MKKIKNFARNLIDEVRETGMAYTAFWIVFLLYFYEIVTRA